MAPKNQERLVLLSLAVIFGSFVSGAAYLAGRQHAPAVATVSLAETKEVDAAAVAEVEATEAEEDRDLATLQAQQAKIEALQSDLEAREAEVAALKAQDIQDESRRAAARERWKAMEAEIEQLRGALAAAEAERDALRGELKQALADLDTQIAENQRVRQRARVYKKANTQNLWSAFVNNAKVEICDKGTRRAHDRCHSAVDSFFDGDAYTRFAACVNTQQAVPVLQQADRDAKVPTHSAALPDDNRFTRKGWYVLYCDPELPEAVAADDIDGEPAVFARAE